LTREILESNTGTKASNKTLNEENRSDHGLSNEIPKSRIHKRDTGTKEANNSLNAADRRYVVTGKIIRNNVNNNSSVTNILSKTKPQIEGAWSRENAYSPNTPRTRSKTVLRSPEDKNSSIRDLSKEIPEPNAGTKTSNNTLNIVNSSNRDLANEIPESNDVIDAGTEASSNTLNDANHKYVAIGNIVRNNPDVNKIVNKNIKIDNNSNNITIIVDKNDDNSYTLNKTEHSKKNNTIDNNKIEVENIDIRTTKSHKNSINKKSDKYLFL